MNIKSDDVIEEKTNMLTTSQFNFSKSKIDKAGDLLSKNNISHEKWEESMQILSSWRAHHAKPLDKITNLLSFEAKKIDNTAIIAKRLKRAPSIIQKLNLLKNSRLSAMQDIGGCRAVLSTKKDVEALTKSLLLEKTCALRNDYIKTPKENGYRSIHIINKSEHPTSAPDVPVEIQIRTDIQHSWATAVEIIDLFTNQNLKSAAQGNKNWKKFFSLASEELAALDGYHEHNIENIIKLDRLTKRLKIFEKYNLYSLTASHIERIKTKENNNIYLFKIDTLEKKVEVTEFNDNDFKSAKSAYINDEKQYSKKNHITISLVSTERFDTLKTAYPNYFADSNKFIANLKTILLKKDSLKSPKERENWLINLILTHRKPEKPKRR